MRIPNNLDYFSGDDRVAMEEYYYRLQLKASNGWMGGEYDNILHGNSNDHVFFKDKTEDDVVEAE